MYYRKILLIPGQGWTTKPIAHLDRFETLVYSYLIEQGYGAIKLESGRKLNAKEKLVLKDLNISTSIIKAGVPDFICWKKNKVLFVEVKSGKSQLTEVQESWAQAFSDVYDILVLRVRLDSKDYLVNHGLLSTKGVIIDGYTSTPETLDALRDRTNVINHYNNVWNGEELKPLMVKSQEDRGEDASAEALYHIIAMEYSDSIIERAKSKLAVLLNTKNKDSDKYKDAYRLLKNAVEKSQRISKEHREKAKQTLSSALPQNRLNNIIKRRTQENKSMTKIYLENNDNEDADIIVKTGLQLKEESSQDAKG